LRARKFGARRPMKVGMTPVIAHVGHWYHSLLYLAPLLVLVVLALGSLLRGAPEDSLD
jgi:hypothetical protein